MRSEKRLLPLSGRNRCSCKRQHGAVLIFCLIFLLALTLMGFTGMESSILEERMAGNMQDYTLAFHAAETALRAGENWLAAQPARPPASDNGASGVWLKNAMDPDVTNSIPWWRESGRDSAGWWQSSAIAVAGAWNLAEPPVYLIEEFSISSQQQMTTTDSESPGRPLVYYRITARGTGRAAASVVLLQSFYVTADEAGSDAVANTDPPAPGRQSWRQLE